MGAWQGITSWQMTEAPKGAIYVWHSNVTIYPKKLAHHLDRDDLIIVGPGLFARGGWRGIRATDIVTDHQTQFSPEENRGFFDCVHYIKAHAVS